jgi:hypothetical protein
MIKNKYPWWVKVSLFGFSTRKSMLIMLFITLIINVFLFYNSKYPLAIIFLIANFLYFISIRWVDKHGEWSDIKNQWANWKELSFGSFLILILYYIVIRLFDTLNT